MRVGGDVQAGLLLAPPWYILRTGQEGVLSAAPLHRVPANQAWEPSAHFPQRGCWGTIFPGSGKYLMVGLGLALGLI